MKKIKGINKLIDNRFLKFYQIDANTRMGRSIDYYFVSRNDAENLKINTGKMDAEGIVVYAVTKEENPRLLLIKEYRYPIDDMVYALPAGLVDAGETLGEAAVREVQEETGYTFEEYTGGDSCFRRSFLMGPGYTDEAGAAVFGYVDLEICKQECEDTEEIEVILADKKMVRKILSEEKVSLRAAYLMMMYLNTDDRNPFDFLELN